LGSCNGPMWQWSGGASKGPPGIAATSSFTQFQTSQCLNELLCVLWFTSQYLQMDSNWKKQSSSKKVGWKT
jgi:hypothetical protein